MTKPYSLLFQIHDLPRMANLKSGKSHWRHAHAESKKWKHLVWATVYNDIPPKPLEKYFLKLTRFSSVEPDYDGLVRGFKHVVDGLVLCGVLANDKLSNSGKWDCDWIKTKPRAGKIQVSVEEVCSIT